jgi:phage gpG-like protein
MQITWSIEGRQELSRKLNGVSLAMKDWRAPLERSATNLIKTFSTDVFSTRGRAIGTSWPPLSPATIARKARGSTPLVETGTMQKSFYKQVHADHAVVGNDTPYFKYHQSNKPRLRLPRRPMMKLGNAQKEMIVREFNKEFQNKIRRTYG